MPTNHSKGQAVHPVLLVLVLGVHLAERFLLPSVLHLEFLVPASALPLVFVLAPALFFPVLPDASARALPPVVFFAFRSGAE